MPPFWFISITMLILSIVMALSGQSWVVVWLSLEINILAFIPMIVNPNHSTRTVESSIKYFLAQAVGSILLLGGGISSSPYVTIAGLIQNAGVAPLHFWFPEVMSLAPWSTAILLCTSQNIAPLFLMFSLAPSVPELAFLATISSAAFGAVGALKQSNIRPLLAYSSIVQIAWIVSLPAQLATFFLVVYIVVLLPIVFFFFNADFDLASSNAAASIIPLLSLLSISGLPPIIGFWPNFLALSYVPWFTSLVLLVASLVIVRVYLSLCFVLFLNYFSQQTSSGTIPLQVSLSLMFLMSLPFFIS